MSSNRVALENVIIGKEYDVVTRGVDNKTREYSSESAPKKRTLSSRTQEVKSVNGDIMVTNTFTFSDGDTFTLSVGGGVTDNKREGTAVNFYEIPTSGGKRRDNRRKSAKKGGRSRRRYNRKSSRRF